MIGRCASGNWNWPFALDAEETEKSSEAELEFRSLRISFRSIIPLSEQATKIVMRVGQQKSRNDQPSCGINAKNSGSGIVSAPHSTLDRNAHAKISIEGIFLV